MTKLILALAWLFAAPAFADKYQCPMHPKIVQEMPGSCPICHMDLEKAEESGAEEAAPAGAARAPFTLPEHRQQLIGVKAQKAQVMELSRELRLAARIGGGGAVGQLLEMDAGEIKAGYKAVLVGPKGQEVRAQVLGVEGALDTLTRSFAVLLAPLERQPWMREGVFCEALVRAPLGRKLAIPAEAVLSTGESAIAFVRSGTRFEPRELKLGGRGEGYVQVLEGLKPGEEVVTSANFLIDSEARFKAALQQR